MESDGQLLSLYAAEKSEEAFSALVQRHLGLVYSAALREMHGNEAFAQDVSQAVFIELARKAKQLSHHPSLAGWLYTTVRHVSSNLRRAEIRRAAREQQAMQTLDEPAPEHGLAAALDDALHTLKEKERHLLAQRFFAGQSLEEIGRALGCSANAARMRIDRALDNLKEMLQTRGIQSTQTSIAATLTASVLITPPASFAAHAATLALSEAAILSSPAILNLFLMTKLKSAVATVIIAGGIATPLIWQYQSIKNLKAENARLTQLVSKNQVQQPNQPPAASEPSFTSDQLHELLRLRGEVAALREKANNNNLSAQAEKPVQPEQTAQVHALISQASNRGLKTPSDAVQTLLWAAVNADSNTIASIVRPQGDGSTSASFDESITRAQVRNFMNASSNLLTFKIFTETFDQPDIARLPIELTTLDQKVHRGEILMTRDEQGWKPSVQIRRSTNEERTWIASIFEPLSSSQYGERIGGTRVKVVPAYPVVRQPGN